MSVTGQHMAQQPVSGALPPLLGTPAQGTPGPQVEEPASTDPTPVPAAATSPGPAKRVKLEANKEPGKEASKDQDEDESSGLNKALDILSQLIPRNSRFDNRGFRAQIRRNLRRF